MYHLTNYTLFDFFCKNYLKWLAPINIYLKKNLFRYQAIKKKENKLNRLLSVA